MESAKIAQLLEAYFEGETTLQEERALRSYFSGSNVVPEFKQYQMLFQGFEAAGAETSGRELKFPSERKTVSRVWIGIAASLLVAVGVFGFFNQQPSITQEEKDALAAFEKTREAFKMLSENFNEGAEELTYVSTFANTKNKILK